MVTEGATSNLFLVKGNQLITHPIGEKVLPGITRQLLLELAPSVGLEPVQRLAKLAEAMGADELFITEHDTAYQLGFRIGREAGAPRGIPGKAGLKLAEAADGIWRKLGPDLGGAGVTGATIVSPVCPPELRIPFWPSPAGGAGTGGHLSHWGHRAGSAVAWGS